MSARSSRNLALRPRRWRQRAVRAPSGWRIATSCLDALVLSNMKSRALARYIPPSCIVVFAGSTSPTRWRQIAGCATWAS